MPHDCGLYQGDNLEVLRRRVADESVDLVYLDPPFKSDSDYDLSRERSATGHEPPPVRAFQDTWLWDSAADAAMGEVLQAGGKTADALLALRRFLGEGAMLAYLAMMAPRLVELSRCLKPTGSLYLHCDPTASHYLKMLLDAVFGPQRFQREIVWRIGWVSGYKSAAKNWIRNHDIVLYYTKTGDFTFNKKYIPYPEGYVRRDGSPPKGKGIPIEDTWNCHSGDVLNSIMIMSFSGEKLGYPTQKPLALLERIIAASSNKGDLVLDPFCGSGTALAAAQASGRSWLGIDASSLAVELTAERLRSTFGLEGRRDYALVMEPSSLEGQLGDSP